MTSTSRLDDRQILFFRRLRRNLVFSELMGFYAQIAEAQGIRKSDLAKRLGKDAAQISRWFAEPANLELDTISDLLLAMDADMEFHVITADSASPPAEWMKDFGREAKSDGVASSGRSDEFTFVPDQESPITADGTVNQDPTNQSLTSSWTDHSRETAVG